MAPSPTAAACPQLVPEGFTGLFQGQGVPHPCQRRAALMSSHLVKRQDVVEVEGQESSGRDLEQLQGVHSPGVLLPQVDQVVDVEELALVVFDGEADLLVRVTFVQELQ